MVMFREKNRRASLSNLPKTSQGNPMMEVSPSPRTRKGSLLGLMRNNRLEQSEQKPPTPLSPFKVPKMKRQEFLIESLESSSSSRQRQSHSAQQQQQQPSLLLSPLRRLRGVAKRKATAAMFASLGDFDDEIAWEKTSETEAETTDAGDVVAVHSDDWENLRSSDDQHDEIRESPCRVRSTASNPIGQKQGLVSQTALPSAPVLDAGDARSIESDDDSAMYAVHERSLSSSSVLQSLRMPSNWQPNNDIDIPQFALPEQSANLMTDILSRENDASNTEVTKAEMKEAEPTKSSKENNKSSSSKREKSKRRNSMFARVPKDSEAADAEIEGSRRRNSLFTSEAGEVHPSQSTEAAAQEENGCVKWGGQDLPMYELDDEETLLDSFWNNKKLEQERDQRIEEKRNLFARTNSSDLNGLVFDRERRMHPMQRQMRNWEAIKEVSEDASESADEILAPVRRRSLTDMNQVKEEQKSLYLWTIRTYIRPLPEVNASSLIQANSAVNAVAAFVRQQEHMRQQAALLQHPVVFYNAFYRPITLLQAAVRGMFWRKRLQLWPNGVYKLQALVRGVLVRKNLVVQVYQAQIERVEIQKRQELLEIKYAMREERRKLKKLYKENKSEKTQLLALLETANILSEEQFQDIQQLRKEHDMLRRQSVKLQERTGLLARSNKDMIIINEQIENNVDVMRSDTAQLELDVENMEYAMSFYQEKIQASRVLLKEIDARIKEEQRGNHVYKRTIDTLLDSIKLYCEKDPTFSHVFNG